MRGVAVRRGMRLVTDDVLVVDLDADVPRCRRGASELRLRTQQAELVSRFATAPTVSTTPNGGLVCALSNLL